MELKHRTVAVVDDEPVTRMDICGMLEEQNFTVVGEASDGFDAIELCRRTKPDVVLLDVRMPVFDGLAAAETIFADDLAGCIVLLTAFSDKDIVERAAAAGVAGYLVKPIDCRELVPTIEVAYAQAQRLRTSQRRADEANKKIDEDRLIHKAQKLFAAAQHCTETQAYERMRRMAMDKRIPVYDIARALVEQEGRNK